MRLSHHEDRGDRGAAGPWMRNAAYGDTFANKPGYGVEPGSML
jgi:hypothetical protein